jgi:hypothetical protein
MLLPVRGNLASCLLTKAGFKAVDGGANDLAPSVKGCDISGRVEYKALSAFLEQADDSMCCQIKFAGSEAGIVLLKPSEWNVRWKILWCRRGRERPMARHLAFGEYVELHVKPPK